MTEPPVEHLECKQCLTFTPFVYARCLNKVILYKTLTECERRKNQRPEKRPLLTDVITSLLDKQEMTAKELSLILPQFKSTSIQSVLSQMPNIKGRKIKGQRAKLYSLIEKDELL